MDYISTKLSGFMNEGGTLDLGTGIVAIDTARHLIADGTMA